MIMNKKNRLLVWPLAALAVVVSAAMAGPVSMWDFETPSTATNVVDQVGDNDGYNHGVRDWPAVAEGAWFMSVRSDVWHRLEAPTAGFSLQAGTFMWMYRSNAYARWDWCDMLTTPLSLDGTNGMRLEKIGGGDSFTFYAGPSNLGASVDFAFINVMDGAWHTVAVTYVDGGVVSLYVDGILRMVTDTYDASQFTLLDKVVLGNRVNLNPLAGDYDYFLYDDACLDAATILDYHTNGYALFCGDPRIPSPPGDFNNDCYVDFVDFSIMAANWMQCTDPADPNNPNCNP